MVHHLGTIADETGIEYDQEVVEKAETHLEFLMDKNAVMAMIYNIDVLRVFQEFSLIYQKQYTTLIGQQTRDEKMKSDLVNIKNGNGKILKQFLGEVKCGNVPCSDIATYEATPVVNFEGKELKTIDLTQFPQLSTFMEGYVDAVIDQIDKYFPQSIPKRGQPAKVASDIFVPLDHKKWPIDDTQKKAFVPGSIQKLSNLLNIPYDQAFQNEFNQLVQKILFNTNLYCGEKKDDPMLFWVIVLKAYRTEMSPNLIRLIAAAANSQVSSADTERTFSQMNLIKVSY